MVAPAVETLEKNTSRSERGLPTLSDISEALGDKLVAIKNDTPERRAVSKTDRTTAEFQICPQAEIAVKALLEIYPGGLEEEEKIRDLKNKLAEFSYEDSDHRKVAAKCQEALKYIEALSEV